MREVQVRRGLPREPGGEPWPAAGTAFVAMRADDDADAPTEKTAPATVEPAGAPSTDPASHAGPSPAKSPAPRKSHQPPSAAIRWAGAIAALAALVVVVVAGSRWLLSLDGVAAFVDDYPGTTAEAQRAGIEIPAWLEWQHFFNVFLMALIVRTGLMVSRQTRPEAYWARRSDPRTRVSLMAWTHQALDVLWVTNGVVYAVALFATGQWQRIVPTSWDVFPHAVSTGLQYAALMPPSHAEAAGYNALQQLGYFTTVFVAAPLAIASGARMSMFWPAGWTRVPVSAARSLHFPVMLYFVVFTVLHVGLVLSTGALDNLNRMYAGSGADSWVGLVVFPASLVVIGGALVAVRPIVVAPLGRVFGIVSGR